MRWPAASLLLLAAAAALGCCASAAADVTVARGHRRDGLLLLCDSTRTQDGRRLQPQQPQHQQSGPFARLMLKKGGISQSKYAPLITEALGTAIITTTVGLLSKSDFPGSLQGLAIGAVVMCLIYNGAQISGGHYNAAVTTVLSLLGKVPARVAVQYIVAQLFGAVGGGFLARGIATSLPDPSGAVTREAGFIDALFSFGLVSTALQTAVSKARAGNSYFGLAIAATVALGVPLGAGMNPSVCIGLHSAGEGSSTTGLLAKCAIPVVGAVLACLAFRLTDVDESASVLAPGSRGLLPVFPTDTVRSVGAYVNELLGAGFLTASVAVALGTGKLPAPVAAGLALTALAFGTGGHLNPAVSLGVHLRDKARFGCKKLAGYSAAQTLGAVAAAAGVKHFLGAGAMAGELPLPVGGYGWQHAFAAEATFTALLVSTVLHAGSNPLAPLAIAAALVGGLFGAGPISGGGLNPSVAGALFVANGKQQMITDSLWIYVLAPLVGAALGTASVVVTSPAVGK